MAEAREHYQKLAKQSSRSQLEAVMEQQLSAKRIAFEREVTFHPTRKWRFDFVFAGQVALECEGGTWVGGRHTRGKAFEGDCEKYAEASLLGWLVIRATTDQVNDGTALKWVERALQIRGAA